MSTAVTLYKDNCVEYLKNEELNLAVEMIYKGINEVNRIFENKQTDIGLKKYMEFFSGMSNNITSKSIAILLNVLGDYSLYENLVHRAITFYKISL